MVSPQSCNSSCNAEGGSEKPRRFGEGEAVSVWIGLCSLALWIESRSPYGELYGNGGSCLEVQLSSLLCDESLGQAGVISLEVEQAIWTANFALGMHGHVEDANALLINFIDVCGQFVSFQVRWCSGVLFSDIGYVVHFGSVRC